MKKTIYLITITLLFVVSASNAFSATNTGLGPFSNKLKTWNKSDKSGNSWINASYKLAGDISYEKLGNVPYAAYAGSNNNTKVTVMKKSFTVAEINGQVAANAFSNSYLAQLKTNSTVVGKKLWSITKNVGKSEADRTQTIWSTKDSSGKEKYRAHKRFTKTFLLPLGPIPFQVEAGGEGEIGITGNLKRLKGVIPKISFGFGPYADLAGIVAARVSVVVARGGVEANVRLIRITQMLTSALTLDTAAKQAVFDFNLPGNIRSLDGKVKFTGDTRAVKTCKVGFVRLPCGFTWTQVLSKTIINWTGISKSWNLYSYKKTFK